MMVPGDIMMWNWGMLDSNSLLVRVCALMSRTWCARHSMADQKVLVELCDEEDPDDEEDRVVKNQRALNAQFWNEIPQNITIGRSPRHSIMVNQSDMLPIPGQLRNYLEEKWKKEGTCPRCGCRGEWVTLALRCPDHGVF